MSGSDDEWEQLSISHSNGSPITLVERSEVVPGSIAHEEIQEFHQEVRGCKPITAAEWLDRYLPTVKTIYAFQILSGAYSGQGWDVIHAVQGEIWGTANGILQADNEGFSNEDGYHILWQFDNDVSGPWHMAVLEGNQWVHFRMSLGNRKHRESFLRGVVPSGVMIERPTS